MNIFRTTSRAIHNFGQGQNGGQIISAGRHLLLFFGIIGLFMFSFNNRPLPERIGTMFSMTLPDNARNFGWYNWTWNGYVTLAMFTVDREDLEATMYSVQWDSHYCISSPREIGFMPDFFTDDNLPWWRPYDATTFDGTSCYNYNPDGLAPNYNVMVDYSIPGEATVYIEEYSIDAQGHRALYD